MKTQLSALIDGEVEAHEVSSIIGALGSDKRLQADWHSYHLIGDALRQEGNLGLDISSRVMTALQNEPTVLAPSARLSERTKATGYWRGMLAMAASLAGVSVVGWLGVSQVSTQLPERVAAANVAPGVVKPVAVAANGNMQEYLIAHQTHSLSGQMQSGTLYIRTVSAER